jgi:hypothetical protein
MANTTKIKTVVEQWYRKQIGNSHKDCVITQEAVELTWGGSFECDAVVKQNGDIVEVRCLSVSGYKTRTGNPGSGKLLKIKADALMFMGIKCSKKVLDFTNKSLYEKVLSEQQNGRFPKEIMLNHFETTVEIAKIIDGVNILATEEMTK